MDTARELIYALAADLRAHLSSRHVLSHSVDIVRESMLFNESVLTDILSIGIEQHVDQGATWLGNTVDENPPLQTLECLWFGIVERIVDDSTLFDIYVIGYRSGGWPREYAWETDSWLQSSDLVSLYALAREQPDYAHVSVVYSLVLVLVATTLRDVLELIGERVLRRCETEQLDIRFGFDSGDLLMLGTLHEEGLDTSACGYEAE